MGKEIGPVSDGDGLAAISKSTGIDQFPHSAALETTPSKDLDLHRVRSLSGTTGILVVSRTTRPPQRFARPPTMSPSHSRLRTRRSQADLNGQSAEQARSKGVTKFASI